MTLTDIAAPAATANDAQALAVRVAALLPARNDQPWTVEPYAAWWSTHPAARLVQAERALILVTGSGQTEVAWEAAGREAYEPDVRLASVAPELIAREVLRLVLPVLDDEAASRARPGGRQVIGRLQALHEIGWAIRERGPATHNHVGLHANSSVLAWGTPSGVRFAVSMHGTNPVCDVSVTGPVRAVERVLPLFLPMPGAETPRYPLRRIRGRLLRRLASHLVQFTAVDQLQGEGGMAFGTGSGPYGYAAPALDPAARVRDSTPVSVDLHGVGIDLLLSRAGQLTR
ncbi:hypothetical protein ACGFYQ_33845 [Streptomyces sp. NPDC048258]|uniref:hypothetical protein n=1 Tax=Streptomyces sp. NPDC048258 TaxID=3365527 RepID=UPI0037141FF8